MEWYFERGNGQEGPIGEDDLRAMLEEQSLSPENKVWNKKLTDWVPARSVLELGHNTAEDPESGEREPSASLLNDGHQVGAEKSTPVVRKRRARRSRRPGQSTDPQDSPEGSEGSRSAESIMERANRISAELRDQPLPSRPDQIKENFLETLKLAGSAFDPEPTNIRAAARARLKALLAAWKMHHHEQADYEMTAQRFQSEIRNLMLSEFKAWGLLALLFIGLYVLVIR